MIVAILEDIEAQANTVSMWLRQAGYETVVRADGQRFIELLGNHKADLLLVDWDVPGINGIEVIRWAREKFADTLPMIMTTHHDTEDDVVYGLNAGADDYLIKPVRQMELLARIQAQVRKYYPVQSSQTMVAFGKYELDPASRRVRLNDVNGVDADSVSLPEREFEVALTLFSNVGRIVTKDSLISKIWGEIDRKYDASLATYISKIRNALALRAKNGLVISTVYSYGYRLERPS